MNQDKEKINKMIGAKILKYRTINNLTQAELAEKTDTTPKFISQLEHGKTGIKIETLIKFINVLNISPNIMFEGLITNSYHTDVSLESAVAQLDMEQKALILNFIDIITEYDAQKQIGN